MPLKQDTGHAERRETEGLYPIPVAVAGVVSNQFGPALLFSFGGLLSALAMLFGLTQRVLREI